MRKATSIALTLFTALAAALLTTHEHARAAPPPGIGGAPPRKMPGIGKAPPPGVYQAPPKRMPLPVLPAVAPRPLTSPPILQTLSREAFPNASFESPGLTGWTTQFLTPPQPLPATARKESEKGSLPSDQLRIAGQVPATVGGDYWKVPFPVQKSALGQNGHFWLESTGLVTSPSFSLQSGEQYLSFLFKQRTHSRLEYWILAPDGTKLITNNVVHADHAMGGFVADLSSIPADKRGSLRVQFPMLVGDGLDDFLIWRKAPSPAALPGPIGAAATAGVWGIADLHTHLFNQMGFGGRMFAGAIHSSMDHNGLKAGNSPRTGRPYSESPSVMEDALRRCHDNHGSAPDGNGTLTLFMEGGHNQGGYPDFTGWPRYSTLSHQQAYVDWLKRAWRGGLRLVHVDVGNSQLLAELYGGVMGAIPGFGRNWTATDDGTTTNAQLAAMHDFVRLPDVRDWVEIAQNAREARRIVGEGKMAFVLGTEVDDLGNLSRQLRGRPANEQRATIRSYMDGLAARGVKHIVPIHVIENEFGAPAVYEGLFDIENLIINGHFFPIRDGFALGNRTQLDIAISDALSDNVVNWIARQIDGADMKRLEQFGNIHGHSHAQGLNHAGRIMIQEAMRHGMVIDLDHMSDQSASDTLSIAEGVRYPLISSHTGFRELAFGSWKKSGGAWVPNTDTPFNHSTSSLLGADTAELMAKERDRSIAHLTRIRALKGMVGLGMGAGSIPITYPQFASTAPQNCDGSSAVFAQILRYANEKMGGRGIAIGTDMNGLNGMANPRFGPSACVLAGSDPIRKTGLRAQADAQTNPVKYRESGMRNNPMGIRGFSETRFLQPNGAYYTNYAEAVTWEALARFKAGAGDAGWGPASVSTIWDGHDFGRDVVRMAYGFFLASTGAGRGSCGRCGAFDTHPDVDSAWDAWHSLPPRAPEYAGVKTVFEAWRKMETTGTNEPLEKSVAGTADFDINVDGFAHYGLLPDYLQDVRNLGVSANEMAPLFRSAEDYIQMWETIEAQRIAALAMPDL